MPAKLSTHVLDQTIGRPAAQLRIDLFRLEESPQLIKTVVTNADGRPDKPLLSGSELTAGDYELLFHIGSYFTDNSVDSPFFDEVPVRFRIEDATVSYHVPLLITPWAYTTYRGS
jgi:5-hydroxyisourate hydrolase